MKNGYTTFAPSFRHFSFFIFHSSLPRRAQRGFTLLEVLVAMAILATVLVVLLENHGMSIRISQRSRLDSIAANLARDMLTEIEIQGFPEQGSETGDFNDRYPGLYNGFTWEKTISDSIFADFLREVIVKVTYNDGGIPHSVELIEMIAATDAEEQATASGTYGGGSESSPAESAMMSAMGRSSSGEKNEE